MNKLLQTCFNLFIIKGVIKKRNYRQPNMNNHWKNCITISISRLKNDIKTIKSRLKNDIKIIKSR